MAPAGSSVVGEPVTIKLNNRATDYLARIRATAKEPTADSCVGCDFGFAASWRATGFSRAIATW